MIYVVSGLKCLIGWDVAYKLALATEGKETSVVSPSIEWRRKMLKCEHSPIRAVTYTWTWHDLPYWVSVHLSRHKVGIEHYVSTQRTDRTGVERGDLPQNAKVRHTCVANAQALINMARKRLCLKASPETRYAVQSLVDQMFDCDMEMAYAMVPECEYRNGCNEMRPCGKYLTSSWK